MEVIVHALKSFMVFNINAIYYVMYLLKHNYIYIFVLCAIGYMLYEEMQIQNEQFVDDMRRIV